MTPEPAVCWGCLVPHPRETMACFAGTKAAWPTRFQAPDIPEVVMAYLCRDCFVDGIRGQSSVAPPTLPLAPGVAARLSTRRRLLRCLICGAQAVVLWPQDSTLDRMGRGVPLCSNHYARAQAADSLVAVWEEASTS